MVKRSYCTVFSSTSSKTIQSHIWTIRHRKGSSHLFPVPAFSLYRASGANKPLSLLIFIEHLRTHDDAFSATKVNTRKRKLPRAGFNPIPPPTNALHHWYNYPGAAVTTKKHHRSGTKRPSRHSAIIPRVVHGRCAVYPPRVLPFLCRYYSVRAEHWRTSTQKTDLP